MGGEKRSHFPGCLVYIYTPEDKAAVEPPLVVQTRRGGSTWGRVGPVRVQQSRGSSSNKVIISEQSRRAQWLAWYSCRAMGAIRCSLVEAKRERDVSEREKSRTVQSQAANSSQLSSIAFCTRTDDAQSKDQSERIVKSLTSKGIGKRVRPLSFLPRI